MTLVALALMPSPARSQQPATVRIGDGQDLQAAIDAAKPGDTILLAAGARFRGNYVLPARSGGSEFITIRTDSPKLPGPGVRIDPALSGTLALIQSGNSDPALHTAPGAHHWRIENVEFGANSNGNSNIISLGDGSSRQRTLEGVPRALVFDRVYVHGDRDAGQKRGIGLNSADTQILNSYFADIKAIGADSQAICGWNGPGPFVIENNYIEAAGENIMFGGSDPAIDRLVPQDIVIRRNFFTKPLAWREPIVAAPASVQAAAAPSGGSLEAGTYVYHVAAERPAGNGGPALSKAMASSPIEVHGGSVTVTWEAVKDAAAYRVYRTGAGGPAVFWRTDAPRFVDSGATGSKGKPPAKGTLWSVKNLLELKNARNVEIDGNTFENNWAAAQQGYALLFKPANQDGKAPWTAMENIRFTNNVVRHVAAGININGMDDKRPSARARDITIANNVFLDISKAAWGGSGDFLQIGGGPQQVVVEHNTVEHTGRVINVYAGPQRLLAEGFVFRGNLLKHNQYGIKGDSTAPGQATIAAYFPGGVVEGNALVGGDRARYPAGNFFPGMQEFDAKVEAAKSDSARLTTARLATGTADAVRPEVLKAGAAKSDSNISGAGADLAAITAAMAGSRTTERAATPARRPGKE
jgi:hypothetical protein